MRYILMLTLCINIVYTGSGQDAHFSQFYASPLTLNPALAGTMNGTFRISAVYRDQWRSALERPLRTYAFSGDTKFNAFGSYNQGDQIGLGMTVYADRAAISDLSTTQITLTGAYHKTLSSKTKSYLSLGLQMGITQRSVNYGNLTFGDQFNAIDDYSLSTLEELPPNNYGTGDFSVGLLYSASPSNKLSYQIGGGLFHFNQPNISFYSKDDNVNPDLIRENALNAKISLHASADIKASDAVSWNPRVLYLRQGEHNEYDAGLSLRFQPNAGKSRAFHIGPWIRTTNNVDGFGVESIILIAGIEMNNWIFGVSYDQNMADLTGTRFGLNSLEVSITYIGEHDNTINWCPQF